MLSAALTAVDDMLPLEAVDEQSNVSDAIKRLNCDY